MKDIFLMIWSWGYCILLCLIVSTCLYSIFFRKIFTSQNMTNDYSIEEVIYGNGITKYGVYYKRELNGDIGYCGSFRSLVDAREYVGLKIQEKKDNEVISKRIVE